MQTQSDKQINDVLLPGRKVQQEQQKAILAFTITIVGIVFYVVLNVIAQLLPPHYSPIRQSVSDLAIGPYGWLLSLMFIIYSVMLLALLLGLIWGTSKQGRSRVGFVFLSLWAVLPAILAFFPTDLVDAHGYPGSVQAFQMTTTLHGTIHLLLSVIAFISALLATLFISLRFLRNKQLRSLGILVLIIALPMWPAFLLTDTFGKMGLYGIDERLFLGLGLFWVLIVALGIRRRLREDVRNAESFN